MVYHDYYMPREKKLNREERCKKRGEYHEENRAKAKERKRSDKQAKFACRMRQSGGEVKHGK